MKFLSQYPLYLESCGSLVKFPVTGKRGNIAPIFEKLKWSSKPISLTSMSSEIAEHILLVTVLKQVENRGDGWQPA